MAPATLPGGSEVTCAYEDEHSIFLGFGCVRGRVSLARGSVGAILRLGPTDLCGESHFGDATLAVHCMCNVVLWVLCYLCVVLALYLVI